MRSPGGLDGGWPEGSWWAEGRERRKAEPSREGMRVGRRVVHRPVSEGPRLDAGTRDHREDARVVCGGWGNGTRDGVRDRQGGLTELTAEYRSEVGKGTSQARARKHGGGRGGGRPGALGWEGPVRMARGS